MKKTRIILIITFVVFFIIAIICLVGNLLIKNYQKDISRVISEIASVKEQVDIINKQVNAVGEEISQIKKNIENLDNNDVFNQKILDELTGKIDDELNKIDRILFLEKEIIKQLSGAYDNFNLYFDEISNYSVRFLKAYLYKIEEPIPSGENYEGDLGTLKVFLNDTNEDYLIVYPWHSNGVSTGMKDNSVKYLYTDEGEPVEYVEYEIENVVYMDFGFENYTLKLRAVFNNENTEEKKAKVMDIVKTIMFYDNQMNN